MKLELRSKARDIQKKINSEIDSAIHENIKAYRCDSCEKRFGHKSHLKKHVKTIHDNIKAYRCDSCDKSFGQKVHLETHVKTIQHDTKAQRNILSIT